MLPRHAEIWLPGLIRQALRSEAGNSGLVHVYFCLVDHFEPGWRGADLHKQRQRVHQWLERYPECAERHRDSEDRPPQHTFFFPEEEYQAEHLDGLALLCGNGWGDVEVHLHHDFDTAAGFEEKLTRFVEILHYRHGFLRKGEEGSIRYGFIHGNWALNNSRADGRYCGVDDETSILLATGCYADFTMPCGPEPSQTRTLNAIYYAKPRTTPRAHESGPRAFAGAGAGEGLLMIQGPFALNWSSRKWGVLPRMEVGDIAWHTPPSAERIGLWMSRHIHVQGAPEHIFIKVSTHGAQDRNAHFLLAGGLDLLWTHLEQACQTQSWFRLHYVSAYEMFQKVRELELRRGKACS